MRVRGSQGLVRSSSVRRLAVAGRSKVVRLGATPIVAAAPPRSHLLRIVVALSLVVGAVAINRLVSDAAAQVAPISIGSLTVTVFPNPADSGSFDLTQVSNPQFTQVHQIAAFNPSASIKSLYCSNSIAVDEATRPFTAVTMNADGTCGTLPLQGNGLQAGIAPLRSFQLSGVANLTVASSGNHTLQFTTDDGWILGIGPRLGGAEQPTYVSGALFNPTSCSPVRCYAVVGAMNRPQPPTTSQVTVNFPVAGVYPIEIAYVNCCTGPVDNLMLVFQQTSGAPVPPTAGPQPPPSVTPKPVLLDNFNRANENPVSQGGNWASIGINGGSGARLQSNRLQNLAQPGTSHRTSTFSGPAEASATITSLPSSNHWLSVYVCLQDAGTAGWDGYELRTTVVSGADLWEIRKVVNGSPSVLASTNLDLVSGGTMLLRRLGNNLEFWWRPPGGDWSLKLSAPDSTYVTGRIGIGGQKSGALDDFGGGDATNVALLQAYAPELRVTSDETYRADSAAIATDLYFPDPNNAHTNFLDRPDGSGGSFAVAAADPSTPLLDLSLSFLNTQALPGDFLNQPNFYGNDILSAATDYSDWVAAHAEYRRFSYARAIVHPATGEKILQYWLFYYYNPKDFVGFGNHEGDWEWVQVRLSAANVPMSVALSQHGDGERCFWGSSVNVSATGHPIVYVAFESHANYFWPGSHPLAGGLAEDITRDDGAQFREVPNLVNVSSNAPRWIDTWDGHWGGSFGTGQSPRTPGKQSSWLDPWAWDDGADMCTGPPPLRAAPELDTSTAQPQRSQSQAGARDESLGSPALPNIRSARIVVTEKFGRAARVSYCFRSLPNDVWRRPWRLHLTLENLADGLPPLSVPWKVTSRCAVVTQPVGGIKPPYLLRYSVESRRGTWSKRVQIQIR